MKKWIIAGVLMLGCWLSVGRAEESAVAAKDAAKSLEKIAAEMTGVCSQGRIHDVFDLYRLLKEFGVTYQSSLTAPHHLTGSLDREQLRLYAGVKLFDALYAATFMKRQDVADCVATIEQIQDSLELRSYADLNNYFLHTLKNAASQPEDVNVQELITQLSTDYVKELPELLSSSESADYLIDSLYGFYIQMNYVTGSLMAAGAADQIEVGFDQINTTDVYKLILDVFTAFDRMDETIRVGGETEEKMAVMRAMLDLDVAETNGTLSDEDSQPQWVKEGTKIADIRNSILTPASE